MLLGEVQEARSLSGTAFASYRMRQFWLSGCGRYSTDTIDVYRFLVHRDFLPNANRELAWGSGENIVHILAQLQSSQVT